MTSRAEDDEPAETADDMLTGVRRWLDTSGRALELRVARVLKAQGAAVQPSMTYTDDVSRLQRELDVLARFGWTGQERTPCSITVAVECKSSTKSPWVAFYDRAATRLGDLENWFSFHHGPFTGITAPLAELWIGRPPLDEVFVATHTVGAHAKDNPADNAVRQVLAAADALKTDYIDTQVADRRGLLVLPLIVTDAPLIACRLDKSGEVALERVTHFHVWGYASDGRKTRVYVLNEARLPAFAAGLRELATAADLGLRL